MSNSNSDSPFVASLFTSKKKTIGIMDGIYGLFLAVKSNLITFILAFLIAMAVSAATITLFIFATASIISSNFTIVLDSQNNLLVTLVIALVLYSLIYSFIYAFTTICIAQSLHPKRKSIFRVISSSGKSIVRVMLANLLVAGIAYWPIAVAAILPFIALASSAQILPIAQLAIIAAIIWAIITQVRYSLVPLVAIFEPNLPVRKTLKRSRQLLKNGGYAFIIKGLVLIVIFLIFLSKASDLTVSELFNTENITVNVSLIVIGLICEGVLAILYFFRSRTMKEVKSSSIHKFVLVILLTVSLMGIWVSLSDFRSSIKIGGSINSGSLSEEEKKEFTDKLTVNLEIGYVAKSLDNFYQTNNYYPALEDLQNTEWVKSNLTITIFGETTPLNSSFLVDEEQHLIGTNESRYHYDVKPDGCKKCESYRIWGMYEKSGEYSKSSQNYPKD